MMLNPPPDLHTLREFSAAIGADPLIIQAAGGNTSVKQGAAMWIKASGTLLAEAQAKDIFVPVDLPGIQTAIAEHHPHADQPAEFALEGSLRPSIETPLHAVFSQRIVVHVHCVNTLAIVIRPDAQAVLADRLHGFDWAFVPYVKPGAQLATLVAKALGPKTDVILLGNHGLIVAAETVQAAQALLTRTISALKAPTRAPRAPDLAALAGYATSDFPPLPGDHPAHQVALFDDLTAVAGAGSLNPDHVIFLGIGNTLLAPGETVSEAVARRAASGLTPPLLLLVPKAGALMRADATASALALARCLGDVLLRLPVGVAVQTLTAEQNGDLLNWDAEKYRQALNAG